MNSPGECKSDAERLINFLRDARPYLSGGTTRVEYDAERLADLLEPLVSDAVTQCLVCGFSCRAPIHTSTGANINGYRAEAHRAQFGATTEETEIE